MLHLRREVNEGFYVGEDLVKFTGLTRSTGRASMTLNGSPLNMDRGGQIHLGEAVVWFTKTQIGNQSGNLQAVFSIDAPSSVSILREELAEDSE